jgi:hypothetical protein
MTTSPFFLIGCARSGTTLLRTMLNHHPEVAIPPESFFLIDYLQADPETPLNTVRQLLAREYELTEWNLHITTEHLEDCTSIRENHHLRAPQPRFESCLSAGQVHPHHSRPARGCQFAHPIERPPQQHLFCFPALDSGSNRWTTIEEPIPPRRIGDQLRKPGILPGAYSDQGMPVLGCGLQSGNVGLLSNRW